MCLVAFVFLSVYEIQDGGSGSSCVISGVCCGLGELNLRICTRGCRFFRKRQKYFILGDSDPLSAAKGDRQTEGPRHSSMRTHPLMDDHLHTRVRPGKGRKTRKA